MNSSDKPIILIVDDERFNITTLNSLLNENYKIMVAPNGEQALSSVQKQLPDLILLDVKMPGIDGYEVCKRLKSDDFTKNIPIIFITALNEAEDETYGLNLGASDYITKPFNHSVVAARVRTQIRLKQQSDLLSNYAFKDGLTGLGNRRAYDQRLFSEWSRCQRHMRPLSVIMLDIDQFKLYNDNYGHGRGDYCLSRIAQVLTKGLQRQTDFIFRYGGEEFVIILSETNQEDASQVAERLRRHIHSAAIPHGFSSVADVVTCSFGVCTVTPAQGIEPQQLVEQADVNLYLSKTSGRDKVTATEYSNGYD